MAIFNSYEIPGKESMGTWTFLDPSGTSCAPGWFFDASTELCKMLGRRFLPGLCGIIIVYYRVYYSILSYIIVYYSTHMLHVYLPTFGWFLGQLLVHIPYMEHRGYIYVYIYILYILQIFHPHPESEKIFSDSPNLSCQPVDPTSNSWFLIWRGRRRYKQNEQLSAQDDGRKRYPHPEGWKPLPGSNDNCQFFQGSNTGKTCGLFLEVCCSFGFVTL